jgi:hypothetical protein
VFRRGLEREGALPPTCLRMAYRQAILEKGVKIEALKSLIMAGL